MAVEIYRFAQVYDPPRLDDDAVIVVENGQEPKKIKSKEIAGILDRLDHALKQATERRNRKSEEQRYKEFYDIWKPIKARMRDPEPGTFPVKYFAPHINGVPFEHRFGSSTVKQAIWLDNSHIIYWGGVPLDTLPQKGYKWKERRLIILNVDTNEIVKTFYKDRFDQMYLGIGFNPKTREISVSKRGFNDKKVSQEHLYGHLMEDFEFIIEEKRQKPRKYDRFYNLSNINARMVSKRKPEGGSDWGAYTFTRADGTTKDIDLDFHVNGHPVYDHIRDQYFISASTKDHRNKIWYFDHDMNIVDEYWIGRVSLISVFPGSRLRIPAKGGFVVPCGRSDANGINQDFDGEVISEYLCYAKYDNSIIRAVKGRVSGLSVSPNGCRVFGFVKDNKDTNPFQGKNFMVDICQ